MKTDGLYQGKVVKVRIGSCPPIETTIERVFTKPYYRQNELAVSICGHFVYLQIDSCQLESDGTIFVPIQ